MKKLLIIGTVWPEPTSSAAGTRMMQLIDWFKDANWEICFACSAAESEFSALMNEQSIRKETIALNDPSFDDFIVKLQPNAVIFDRFMSEEQYGWRVAQQCSQAIRILDTEDLHCLRIARQLAVSENREMTDKDLKNDNAIREIASILRCDLTLMISTFEMELLQSVFHIDEQLLQYLPIQVKGPFSFEPSFEERNDFVSIGNFRHPPNADAIRYLKNEIWPLIRKVLPDAKMHVYGSYPSPALLQLNHPSSGFLVHGKAKDAFDVMRKARVCLAPLRFGAGIKGKLLEAMICGTPSVTTSIGAEGMQGNLPWNGYVCNDANDFAIAAEQLYTSKDDWTNAQVHGKQILESLFSSEEHAKGFMNRVSYLLDNLDEHRLTNFTGAMLMHHTIQSTKYLSKWIEEKNRKV
jgi:glycosyltransferase involved in cell wall biosynthesis